MVKIKGFFRRYWLFIFLAFLATILAMIVLFRTKPSHIVEEPQLPLLNRPLFQKAKITTGAINYQLSLQEEIPQSPEKLAVYRARPPSFFDYSKLTNPNLEGEKIITSTTQAAGLAKTFLEQNKRLPPDLKKGTYGVKFFKVSGYEVFQTENFASSDILTVHFYPQIDDYLVLGSSPFSALVEVWVGKNGQIQKVKDFLAEYDRTDAVEYPLVSFDQAWQMITNQKGTIVSLVVQEKAYAPPAVKIENVTIIKAYLAYFQEQELPSKLQPIWVFEGQTTAVYLPAIVEKYFTPEL